MGRAEARKCSARIAKRLPPPTSPYPLLVRITGDLRTVKRAEGGNRFKRNSRGNSLSKSRSTMHATNARDILARRAARIARRIDDRIFFGDN